MNILTDYKDRLAHLQEGCASGSIQVLSKTDQTIADMIPAEHRNSVVVLGTGDIIVTKNAIAAFSGLAALVRRLEMRDIVCRLIAVSESSEMESFFSTRNGEAKISDDNDAQRTILHIVNCAVNNRASDIHIDVEETSVRVQFRVDGDMVRAEKFDKSLAGIPVSKGESMLRTAYESMCDIRDPEYITHSQQDGRMDRKYLPHSLYGVRIARSQQLTGQYMEFRLLYDNKSAGDGLLNLGYTTDQLESIQHILSRPTGFIVIGGGTGSGKSTTLKNMLAYLHEKTKGRKNIITVEDPPEYPIAGARQIPVANAATDEERSAAFIKAIRFMLRADPDICMIGEIRDLPSADLALQAAMTGHLVFSTLHVDRVHMIMPRLQHLGLPQDIIANASLFTGLICQTLVKKLCPKCKKKLLDIPPSDWRSLTMKRMSMAGIVLDEICVPGDGCPDCNGTGHKGRTVIASVVV